MGEQSLVARLHAGVAQCFAEGGVQGDEIALATK